MTVISTNRIFTNVVSTFVKMVPKNKLFFHPKKLVFYSEIQYKECNKYIVVIEPVLIASNFYLNAGMISI